MQYIPKFYIIVNCVPICYHLAPLFIIICCPQCPEMLSLLLSSSRAHANVSSPRRQGKLLRCLWGASNRGLLSWRLCRRPSLFLSDLLQWRHRYWPSLFLSDLSLLLKWPRAVLVTTPEMSETWTTTIIPHHSPPQVHPLCSKVKMMQTQLILIPRWRMWNLVLVKAQRQNLVRHNTSLSSWYSPSLLKHASPRNGSRPSTYSSPPLPVSNMSMTITSTSFSVLRFNVKEGTVMMCVSSWILDTPGWPVGCSTMQKCARVRRLSMLWIKLRILRPHVPFLLTLAWKEMAVSLLHSSASGSPASHIHIVNSHIQKQGKSTLTFRVWLALIWTQDWDCEMGRREKAALCDCWGSPVHIIDEDWASRISIAVGGDCCLRR